MSTVHDNFKLYKAEADKLEKELGGEVTLNPGRGGDWMEVSWTKAKGKTFYDRIIANPAIGNQAFSLAEAKVLFEYNTEISG